MSYFNAPIRLPGSTSGHVSLTANAATTSYTLTFPADDGTNNNVLKTDGSGNTYWTAQTGGISFDGSTANGVLTYKDSDEATVESGLTFDSNILTLTADASSLKFGDGTDVTFTHDNGTGMDVTSAGDFDITSTGGNITLTSQVDEAASIYIRANAGTSESIKIHSDQGTSVTEGAASVSLLSDVGGVELRSTANLVNAINITNDGGTTGTITIFNDQGTSVTEGAASIQLLTDAGGIGIKSTANLANAILLTVDGGTSETIKIHADQSTVDGAAAAGAIELTADAGGISLNAADDKDIWIEGGQTVITANHNTSEAIKLHADAGASQTIQIINDAGTTDGAEGAGAIDIEATVGGISIHAADDKDIWIEGGQTVITANHNTSEAIKLHADAGASQTIQIINDAGTTDGAEGAGAIDIEATLGGIGIHAADDKDIWIEGGQTVITANHNVADSIKLHAEAGTTQTIRLLNEEGTSNSAVNLTATDGGISLNSQRLLFLTDTITVGSTGQITATSASGTIHNPIASVVYLQVQGSSTDTTYHWDLRSWGKTTGGAYVDGQYLQLFYDNALDTSVTGLTINFGSNILAAGSGLASSLTFSNNGQSATLIVVGQKWRIINTGAAIA